MNNKDSIQTTIQSLTQKRLKELLRYDGSKGKFVWRVDRIRVRKGEVAGKLRKDGYIDIGIDGKRYPAHRLAFLYMNGSFPFQMVDHINLNKADNRWCNLRLVTNSQNQMNTSMKANNTSGFKGVSWHKNERRWRADTRIGGIKCFIGYFDTPEEGHAAYKATIKRYHGEYARGA